MGTEREGRSRGARGSQPGSARAAPPSAPPRRGLPSPWRGGTSCGPLPPPCAAGERLAPARGAFSAPNRHNARRGLAACPPWRARRLPAVAISEEQRRRFKEVVEEEVAKREPGGYDAREGGEQHTDGVKRQREAIRAALVAHRDLRGTRKRIPLLISCPNATGLSHRAHLCP